LSCYPVAAVILAAGSASRMGTPKQLLPYRSATLVAHAIDTAAEAGFEPVILVIGAHAQAVRSAVASKRIDIVENPDWQTGMGSSIRAGVARLLRDYPEVAALALLVGDQPLVTAEHLAELRRLLLESDSDAAAAAYGGSLGVPALLRRKLFARLLELKPEEGAKALLQSPDIRVATLPLPEAGTDIDTKEDWQRITGS
jgi:molybdenum cofactor cytidylyltransferase